MSKDKKKFGQTKVGQFLAKSGLVNNLLDVVPDKGVLGIVKNILKKDDTLPPVDKEQALKLLEMDMAEMEAVTRRWEADAKSGKFFKPKCKTYGINILNISLFYWFLFKI